jgi:hypothetical protein
MSDNLDFILNYQDVLLTDGTKTSTAGAAAEVALAAGHGVAQLVYPGSGISSNVPNVYELDLEHLKEANKFLMRANKSMHRSWPRQQLAADNALRRDLWIVRWAHSLYIFGLFTQDASILKINTDVAWSAQMYVDRFVQDGEPIDLCELYLFDMKSEAWWQWKGSWNMIANPPTPCGIYTVLGQDKLSNGGKAALKKLWEPINQ